jgi:hypothetical protein
MNFISGFSNCQKNNLINNIFLIVLTYSFITLHQRMVNYIGLISENQN